MRLAIMQLALWPPASYFRLFAASDVFVIYDNVQFMPRWYTHRQKLTTEDGSKQWCTLPLKKMSQQSKINEMEFLDDFEWRWAKQIKKFPILEGVEIPSNQTPLMFIVNCMLNALDMLQIPIKVKLASNIDVPDDLRGQSRIMAICKKLGATEYVNSPGGRSLYHEAEFEKHGIKLKFLPEWTGGYDSILERLAHEKAEDIRNEIYSQI